MTGNYLFVVAAALALVILVGCGTEEVVVEEELDLIDPELIEVQAQFMEVQDDNMELLEDMAELQARLTDLRDENQMLSADLAKSRLEATELGIGLDDLAAQNQGRLMKMESVDKKLLEEMVEIQAKLTGFQDENQTLLVGLAESRMEAADLKSQLDALVVQNLRDLTAMEGDNKKLLEDTVKLQAKLTDLRDENQTLSAGLTKSRIEATELKVRLDELVASGGKLQNLASLLAGLIRVRLLSEEPAGIVDIMGKVARVEDPELRYKMYVAFESIGTPEEDELMIDLMKRLSSRIEILAGGGVVVNPQAGLDCDKELQSQLVFQRGATAKNQIQVVIAQIQSRRPECALNVWKPVAIDMDDGSGLCYRAAGGYMAGETELKVGGQALPVGLQRTVGEDQVPSHASGRDSADNIIVYWADATVYRPTDSASCWLYDSDLRTWHANFF